MLYVYIYIYIHIIDIVNTHMFVYSLIPAMKNRIGGLFS